MLFCLCVLFMVTMKTSSVPTETFEGLALMDPHFQVYWKTNHSHITFELHVAAHGYVGFGLTANASGAMYPGDLILGYVSNNQSYFGDYHTTRHGQPILDASQDWFLLLATEDNDETVLKFTRAFNTQDKQDDIDITASRLRVHFSALAVYASFSPYLTFVTVQ
ncbi:hypothetical protein DPMN_010172 [Dreissena polymorpha]|uniref:DOMON domain-containing protein n=1 Tax=Dreissena polymorpha TaxID=45954 RepID=A0A9D4RYY3_DREPO|nr:hypothetical protein DPMN_010172 [Dreissena polymorpha]